MIESPSAGFADQVVDVDPLMSPDTVGAGRVDSQLCFVSANTAMIKYAARALPELMGKDLAAVFPHLSADIYETASRIVRGEFNAVEREVSLCDSGRPDKFHLGMYSARKEDGSIEGLHVVIRPIHPLSQIEPTLMRRLRFEQLINELSGSIARLPADEIDDAVTNALRRIIEHLNLDRSTLFEVAGDADEVHTRYTYSRPGIKPANFIRTDNLFPWMWSKLSCNEIVSLADPDEIPSDAVVDRQWMELIGPRAIVVVPIHLGGRLAYLFTLESFEAVTVWPPELASCQRLAGELLGAAAARKNAHLELKRRLEFERTLREISSLFINPAEEQFDDDIKAALKLLVELTAVDRASIGMFSKDAASICIRHAYAKAGVASPPVAVPKRLLPWFTKRIKEGRLFRYDLEDDAPPGASSEDDMMRAEGIKSYLGFPLRVQDTMLGFLGFTTLEGKAHWESGMITSLETAASVMSNAIARREANLELAALRKELEQENLILKEVTAAYRGHESIIGSSACMQDILSSVAQVGPTRATVLITGETGTGKELIAKAIHGASDRSRKTMVTVNCAALPSTLIESELFGREQGAYTGAMTRQIGRFEMAHGSTLFLDEIGDLSIDLQSKLLRVLQEGEFERLGSSKTIKVDVRVIAATNRDLAKAVREGVFREDLYYRLRVFPLSVPPLRERLEDIPLLVWSFVQEFGRTMGRAIERIPREDMSLLQRYSWPGNIRELRNVVEHAMIVSSGNVLRLAPPVAGADALVDTTTLDESIAAHIRGVLQRTRWRVKGPGGAAEILGINPATLRSKMKKLGIHHPQIDQP